MTPALRDRGIARELLRKIGELRKAAGCKVTDRVRVGWEVADDVVRGAIKEHGAHIEAEALSALSEGALEGAQAAGEVELDEAVVKLTLLR